MRYSGIVMVGCALLLAHGCDKAPADSSLPGKWRGQIVERGKATEVELALEDQQGQLRGRFTVLSKTGGDIDKGMSFETVQVEHSGDRLKFVVPLTGKLDSDALVFDLTMKDGQLVGNGHEMRTGSRELPITFTRHK